MAFPTVFLGEVQAGNLGGAASGTLVSFLRNEQVVTGIALGTVGAPATHVLLEGDGGVPWLYAVDAMGAQVKVLHFAATGRLLLDVSDNEADGRQLNSYVGCLGMTSEGLIVCAAGGRDGWREHIQSFVRLDTLSPVDVRPELLFDAKWLTNWSLSYRTAKEQPMRLLGNPQWPQGALLRR